jgi:hypothetical protein
VVDAIIFPSSRGKESFLQASTQLQYPFTNSSLLLPLQKGNLVINVYSRDISLPVAYALHHQLLHSQQMRAYYFCYDNKEWKYDRKKKKKKTCICTQVTVDYVQYKS